jgi:hypothetical protein
VRFDGEVVVAGDAEKEDDDDEVDMPLTTLLLPVPDRDNVCIEVEPVDGALLWGLTCC